MASAEGQLSFFEVDAFGPSTNAPEVPQVERRSTSSHVGVQPTEASASPSRAASAAPRASSATSSLLSAEDVARRCGLSRKAVYRAVARGELRASRILSRLRIDPRDVEAWIRANVVDAGCPTPAPTPFRLPAATGLRRLLPEP
jgi:excisionase family DNA binding protein